MKENTENEEKKNGSNNHSETSEDDSINIPSEIETQVEKVSQVIGEVPEENRSEVISMAMKKSEYFLGPIPPPSLLAGYEEVAPGSADRIIKMAENEQSHRMNMENKCINAEIGSEKRGQWMGLGVAIAVLGIIALFAILGMTNEAFWALGGTGVALGGLFIYGRYRTNQGIKSGKPKE